jgi:hypothetical protein
MLARLERRLAMDNEFRARLLFWFWVISLGVLLLGFGIIAWHALVAR